MASRIRPGPLPDPALLADALVAMRARMDELKRRLGLRMSVHRTLILLLAYDRPIHAVDVRAAARSLEGTALYDELGALRYQHSAYKALRQFVKRGAMTRVPGPVARYRLTDSVRARLARVMIRLRTKPRARPRQARRSR